MSLIDFESSTEIKKKKNLEREARQDILDKAREKYEKDVKREQEARERGETTWMLPSVEDKINPKQKEKKKKKKDKKEKKDKKAKKKKKKKMLSSSSSTSDDEIEKETNNIWVEKTPNDQPAKREEWMEVSSLFKTQTREQMKIADGSSRALKKLEERKRKEDENKPGSHALELNPYYKNGGVGVPSEAVPSDTVKTSSYDASWLKKALQRAKDQATEEGRTLEEVAAERWGSLDTFYKLLNEAKSGEEILIGKGARECKSTDRMDRHKEERFGENEKSERLNRRIRSRSRERRKRSRSRSRERRKRSISRTRDRERNKRSRSREKNKQTQNSNVGNNSKERSRSRSRSQERNRHRRRSRSSSSDSSGSSSSRDSSSSSSSSSSSRRRRRRLRRRSDLDSSIERKTSKSRRYHDRTKEQKNEKSGKLQMMKPPESDDEMTATHRKFQKPDEAVDFSTDPQVQRSYNTKNKSASWRKKTSETPKAISNSRNSRSPESKDGDSSSTTSDSEDEKIQESKTSLPEPEATVVPVLTDKEMNQLAAKLTKAELLGNTTVVEKLRVKLDAARHAREKHGGEPSDFGQKRQEERDDNVVVLTRTDKSGFTRPVEGSFSDNRGSKKKNKTKMFDSDGKRTSYFADDVKSDLQSMFEKEKTTSAEDQIAFLENLPRYTKEKLSDDFDVDDMFIAKVAPKESAEKERERDRKRAVWEHQKSQKALDSCHFCIDNKLLKKHLIVALGKKCYVSLPYHQSLTEGHCMIVPLNHVPCGTQAEEDLWEEITSFRQALVRMFSSNDEDCVFFETATKLHQMPHMVLQCIPLPKETGDLAPIYFKKAILDCDEEWAQNKKLIDLKGKSVRKAVPKELPYFYCDFGMTPGFAHVIENELLFPNNFAQEIIGGMIDADYSLFRKPKAENFDLQRKKVLKFGKMFQPFDPTENN